MSIVVACACGQQMTVDDQFIGRQVSCIQCGGPITVMAPPPGSEASAPEEPLPPPPPVVQPQTAGKRRRTFVADWAKDISEAWAEEHPDQIADDFKPSTAVCVIAGIATIIIGAYNTLVYALLLAGVLLAKAGGAVKWTEGNLLLAVVSVLTLLGIWTLVSGATCIAARPGGAAAAIPLNLIWALLAMLTMVQVQFRSTKLMFWVFFLGVVLLCCVGTVLSAFARRQAERYQLWVVKRQQEAEGSLVG